MTTPAARPGPLVHLDDPGDDRVSAYRDLTDAILRRRVELDEGVFVVEGRLAVRQLLRSPYRVHSLLLAANQVDAQADVVAHVRASGAPVYVATREVLAATVGFDLHRGVVALGRRPAPIDAARLLATAARVKGQADTGAGSGPRAGGQPARKLLAILEGINDHENLGALFRNAAAFGVAGVLLDPTCADPLYRRAVRVSVGHVLSVPFARLTRWPAGLAEVRAAGYVIAALTPDPAPLSPPPTAALSWLDVVAGDTPVALVVGAEGPGLSEAVRAEADVAVSIPMAPGVDSLNVATAAAIAFHQLSAVGLVGQG
jgi:tRNA G18 (ribose-2'-O)-methylase SpoU